MRYLTLLAAAAIAAITTQATAQPRNGNGGYAIVPLKVVGTVPDKLDNLEFVIVKDNECREGTSRLAGGADGKVTVSECVETTLDGAKLPVVYQWPRAGTMAPGMVVFFVDQRCRKEKGKIVVGSPSRQVERPRSNCIEFAVAGGG